MPTALLVGEPSSGFGYSSNQFHEGSDSSVSTALASDRLFADWPVDAASGLRERDDSIDAVPTGDEAGDDEAAPLLTGLLTWPDAMTAGLMAAAPLWACSSRLNSALSGDGARVSGLGLLLLSVAALETLSTPVVELVTAGATVGVTAGEIAGETAGAAWLFK